MDPSRSNAPRASAEPQRSIHHSNSVRVSSDAKRPHTPKLRKKRSKPEIRVISQQHLKPASSFADASKRYSGTLYTGPSGNESYTGKRKSSLRNVVRRIFGRRSKGDDNLQVPAHRHTYHKSVSWQF